MTDYAKAHADTLAEIYSQEIDRLEVRLTDLEQELARVREREENLLRSLYKIEGDLDNATRLLHAALRRSPA